MPSISSYYTGSSFSSCLHCPEETLFLACHVEKFWNTVFTCLFQIWYKIIILIVVKDKFSWILFIINFSTLIGFYYNLRVTDLAHSVYGRRCHIIQLTRTVLFVKSISQIMFFCQKELDFIFNIMIYVHIW